MLAPTGVVTWPNPACFLETKTQKARRVTQFETKNSYQEQIKTADWDVLECCLQGKMSKGQIETSQSPSVSRPPILLHWNCTSPPCLNVTPISGVHTGHRGWWSTIELSEIIWPSQKLSGEVLKLTVSTIGGSIARVEMEFGTQSSSSSSGWAQQTEEEEISELHQHSSSNCCSHFAPGLTFVRHAFPFLTYHC